MFDIKYTPDFLGLSEKELSFINSDFKASVEFVDGHIYNIIVSGNAAVNDVQMVLDIGDLILVKLREKGYTGRFHSMISISELKSITTDGRKLALKKLSQWTEFDAFVFIGSGLLIKTLVNVYKRFNPEFKVFFVNDVKEAIDFIRISCEKKSKPDLSFFQNKELVSKPEWVKKSADGKFSMKICLLDDNIYIAEPTGYAGNKDVGIVAELIENVLKETNPRREKYYRIQDYSKMTGSSVRARQEYINWMKNNIDDIHLTVFYGLKGVMKSIVYFGKILYPNTPTILIANSYDEALDIVYKHKKGIKSKSSDDTIKEQAFQIPESKEDVANLVHLLIDENKILKESQEFNARKLFEIIGKISWDYKINIEDSEIQSEPFSDVFHAIQMLRNDVNDLLAEKDFYFNQMKEREEKYYSLFENSSASILIVENGFITEYNKKTLEIFRTSENGILGKEISGFFKVEDEALKVSSSDEPNLSFEAVLQRSDKDVFEADIQINNINFNNRKITQFVIRDITEKNTIRRELEKYRINLEKLVNRRTSELEKAKQRAEESDRLKTTFLANMSHEIRTPMNVIIGFADMLLDSDFSAEKQKEYLRIINKSGNSLLMLINDIIDLAKIEANQLIIDKSDFNVYDLLKELETEFFEFRKQYNKEHIEIELHMEKEELVLFSDPFRIKQIFTNLLNNAFKFTNAGKIKFGCEAHEKQLRFFVEDSGIGIKESDKDIIFEQFRQIDESTTKEYEGTGLGLAITKNLVNILGGEISVSSEPDKGSLFYFYLPLIVQKAPAETKCPDVKEKTLKNWSGKKVLVVEDEDMNYKYIYEILKPTGVNIIRASNGNEAIDLVTEYKHFDLILMDIQLPGLSGFEITKRIKYFYPDIPVIAQTAFAMAGEKEKCIAAGCNDYIAKPIRKKNLLNTIDKYL